MEPEEETKKLSQNTMRERLEIPRYASWLALFFALFIGLCIAGEDSSASNDSASSQIQTSSNHLEKLKYRYNLHTTKKQGAVKGGHTYSPILM